MDDYTPLEKTIRAQQTKYYGKYRAFVDDNKDPEKRGRCKLIIPSVMGDTATDWAMPAFAYGGGPDFGMIAVPPKDSQVIAEFLEGDLSAPMWTGAFWRKESEVPEAYKANEEPSAKVLRTESGHLLVFEDKKDEEHITLTSKHEAVIELDPKGSIHMTAKDESKLYLDAEKGELTLEDANGNSMVMSSSGISVKDANGHEITTSASGVTVKATKIVLDGSNVAIAGEGGEPVIKGTSLLAAFNTHTHVAPLGPTSPPVKPLDPSVLSTKATVS